MRQTRAALAAGVVWLEIDADVSVSDDTVASVIDTIRPELAERNCMLILAGRIDTAKTLKADGVHIYRSERPVSAVRVALDAWPIIGVSVSSRDDAEALRGYDIDYLYLDRNPGDDTKPVSEIAAWLEEKDIETPLVAAGAITAADVEALARAGANAVAIDASVAAESEKLQATISELKKVADMI